MNNRRLLPFYALTLLLSACAPGAPTAGPLADAAIGGPFSLIDQDGHRVSDASFAGRYRLMYFGYSYCPDVCPTDLQKLMGGLKLFEKQDPARAAKIQPIFVTVDPARDTPPVLKAYVAAFHPRLLGLTGSEADIAKVAKEFGIYYRKAEAQGSSDYLVDHVRQATLFGTKGEPIALIPQDESVEAVAAELGKWVR